MSKKKGSLRNPFKVDVPEGSWELTGNVNDDELPHSVLYTTLSVCGCLVHLQAVQVQIDSVGSPLLPLKAINAHYQSSIDELYVHSGWMDEDKPETFKAHGGTYLPLLIPFAY